ncbi:MAG: sulfatase-like hydrolase/transferase, partial [Candidatus Solibacter sp.]|nr:sulfatase-like hydrolase/transferase [Candidatus Solibacter sp.]
TRAGLLTGRYQTRFGHERNVVGEANLNPNTGLPTGETTIADLLKRAGYATGAFGKWHLGSAPQFHPQRRGFDEFFGFLHEGHFYLPQPYKGGTTRLRPNEPPYDQNNPLMRGSSPVEEPVYLTDAITREATAFIDRHANAPFFLYVPYNAVHSPMQATTESMRRFNGIGDEHRQVFAGMLAALDDGVGAILRRLRERNLEEDTMVIFLSDNGGPTGELTSSNAPLRGFKGQLWEGGIRIPFMMLWKGRIPAGRTLHQPVISLDILPTALAAAGAPAPASARTDGADLLPLATGATNSPPHDSLFWRYGNAIALRRGNWKLVRQPAGPAAPPGPYELYNLADDVAETRNLAAAEPALAAELRAELDRMNGQMRDPLW